MKIEVSEETKNKFQVNVNNKKFLVALNEDYYQKLTTEKFSKEELIIASFKFLLDREPAEQILFKFNLQIIKKYFPEYEQEIKNYLKNKN